MRQNIARTLKYACLVGVSAALLPACGGGGNTKKDPVTPVVKKDPPKQEVKGVSKAAVDAFNEGVAALKKTPADYAAAAVAFEKATKVDDKYLVAWANLGFSYEKLGRYADAVTAYRKVLSKNVVDRGMTLALGRALLLSGEPDLAITEFESILRKHPDDLEARNNLAAAYRAKSDTDTSLRYVKEVLAVQPKNVPAIINLGLIYLEQNKLPLAQLMFTKALSYDKDNAKAMNNLGLTLFRLKEIPSAVVQFRKAVMQDPTMDEARLNLASIYLDYLHYENALQEFKAVRARFPKHYAATVGAANSLYGTQQFEEAAKLYEASLETRKDNSEVYLRLAKIYEEQLNNQEKALVAYKAYVELAKPPQTDPIYSTIQFLEQNLKSGGLKPAEEVSAPAEGGEAAPAEGGEAAPAEGGEAAPAEGDAAEAEAAAGGEG